MCRGSSTSLSDRCACYCAGDGQLRRCLGCAQAYHTACLTDVEQQAVGQDEQACPSCQPVMECVMCMEAITPGVVGVHFGCRHTFCLSCVSEWAQNSCREHEGYARGAFTCPSCRAPIEQVRRDDTVGWPVSEFRGGQMPCEWLSSRELRRRSACRVCRQRSARGMTNACIALVDCWLMVVCALVLAGHEGLRQCVACWRCYHHTCLSVQERSACLVEPDVCHSCLGNRVMSNNLDTRGVQQIESHPYRWPPSRMAAPSDDAWTPAVQMSFVFVPLLLCALSSLPGARGGGYLHREDVARWRILIDDFYRRPWVQVQYRGVVGLPANSVVTLSFDRLIDGLAAALQAVHGSRGDARAIHAALVRPTDGYISASYQESVFSPADGNVAMDLTRAGMPERLAVFLYNDGYRYGGQVVMSAANVDGLLAGNMGVRRSRCVCNGCMGDLVVDVFVTCTRCSSSICFACTGRSTVPVGQWLCRRCELGQVDLRLLALPMGYDAPADGALHVPCVGCMRAIHPALLWSYVARGESSAVHRCAACICTSLCATEGRCSTTGERVDQVSVWDSGGGPCVLDVSHVVWQRPLDGADDGVSGRFHIARVHEAPTGDAAVAGESLADEVEDGSEYEQWEDDGIGRHTAAGERDVHRTGLDSVADPEVDTLPAEASDEAVWAAIRRAGAAPSVDRGAVRALISRLHRRPRNVRNADRARADEPLLAELYELWNGSAPPTGGDAAYQAYGRLLRQIQYRSRQGNGPTARRAQRSAGSTRNTARINRSLLAGTVQSVAASDVGLLQTGDPEVDGANQGQTYYACSACDACLLLSEVTRSRGRVYGRHCCRHGQVALRPLQCMQDAEMGQLMREMWLTRPSRLSPASLARRHGRMLNSTFAMSCQAVRCRPMLTRGMQTFVVNARIAHFMGSLLPEDGERPQFAQLYVHDAYTNAAVGSRVPYRHQDALRAYFARSRTNRIGEHLQNALVDLVARLRPAIMRVCMVSMLLPGCGLRLIVWAC